MIIEEVKGLLNIWKLWMAVVMLSVLGACSSDGTEEQDPVLNIHVYAPGNPTPTRSVSEPTSEEKKVHNLKIWVYKSNSDVQIGSLALSESELTSLNEDNGGIYTMAVSREFAKNPEPVDVYVLANVSADNSGTDITSNTSEKSDIENLKFNDGYYYGFVGDSHIAATSLSSEGLPMSGVVRGKAVKNVNSVLHMTDANLQLMRAVSKIRFVFSSIDNSTTDNTLVYIDGVTLDENMFYTSEYLFLNDEFPYFHLGSSTVSSETTIVSKIGDYVKRNPDPRVYAYVSGMDESAFEANITQGISEGELTEAPTAYLPESDKKLTGTISYHLNDEPAATREASFSMLNGDFRRNQTWIVYAYYTGSSKLEVITVKVTDWEDGGTWNHNVHNW